MKKLLVIFGIIAMLGISSCSNTITKKTSLPVEVISLREVQKYDTFLVIKTNEETHLFDKNQQYIGTYSKSYVDGVLIILITLIIVFTILSIVI